MPPQLAQTYASCFFPSIFLSALWLVWLPLNALHTHLLLLNSFSSGPMTQSKGSSSPPLEESSFPSPVLRTCVPKKENLCKKKMNREVSLGEGQEGRKTKCDDITLQFLHILEFCQPAVLSAEHLALRSMEQLHLPQNATGLLSLPGRSKKWQYCLFLLLRALPMS